ncbi:MAG: hypothetical protein LIR50_13990 [Bacillota bacterium]|nr:hypothetical protein [Bacillota bacterium]
MKYINTENWKRKDHYNYFKQLDYPHFNICGNLDITNFYKYIKENELPFFISFLYAAVKTANDIEEFKFTGATQVTFHFSKLVFSSKYEM